MEKIAFEIGFDFYRYSATIIFDRCNAVQIAALQQGYDAASIQKVTRVKRTMYDSKLLMIRKRAYLKNIDVTITAHDLKVKLAEAGNICPVTLKPFTFGEQKDTDWSIDRIDNTSGYHPDNIIVVSVIVNKTKSDNDLVWLLELAIMSNRVCELSANERFRMAEIYYNRMRMCRNINIIYTLHTLPNHIFTFILGSAFLYYDNATANILTKLLSQYNKDIIKKTQKLIKKRAVAFFRIHNADCADCDCISIMTGSDKLTKLLAFLIDTIITHQNIFNVPMLNFIFNSGVWCEFYVM